MTVENELFFLARRFVAGTNVEHAVRAVRRLNAQGLSATVDFLGEDVMTREDAVSNTETYAKVLHALRIAHVEPNVSVKLSSIGLLVDEALAYDNLMRIVASAILAPGSFVCVDMEGSSTVKATLGIVLKAFKVAGNVGPVLQAYLRRTPVDMANLTSVGARIRLCKGAYNEPATIAFKSMRLIRDAYVRLAEGLLLEGSYPAFATHDRSLIASVQQLAHRHNRAPDTFEFQMLYGVRPSLQRALAREGYRVRVYVPFGTRWKGYFRRRIMERKENALFALGAVFSK